MASRPWDGRLVVKGGAERSSTGRQNRRRAAKGVQSAGAAQRPAGRVGPAATTLATAAAYVGFGDFDFVLFIIDSLPSSLVLLLIPLVSPILILLFLVNLSIEYAYWRWRMDSSRCAVMLAAGGLPPLEGWALAVQRCFLLAASVRRVECPRALGWGGMRFWNREGPFCSRSSRDLNFEGRYFIGQALRRWPVAFSFSLS